MTTTNTTSKMTNSKALAYILEHCDIPTDVREKVEKMKEQVDKKSSAERKPTATQTANKAYAEAIIAFLTDCGEPKTVTEIIKGCAEVSELTNQRVSAIIRTTEGIKRIEDKRKAYFTV